MGHYQHQNTPLAQLPQLFHQVPANIVQPAQAKGLDHQAPVTGLHHIIQHAGLGAGHQFEQKDPAVHRCPQDIGPVNVLGAQEMHAFAVDHPAQAPVYAVKGVEAGGTGFDRPGTQNQLAVKAHISAGHPLHGRLNGAGEVRLRVGEGSAQGQLAPGENHWLAFAQEHKAQRSGSVSHGIRAVGDDHAVTVRKGLIHRPGQLRPLFGLNIAGVHGEHVPADQFRLPRHGDATQQLLPAERGH